MTIKYPKLYEDTWDWKVLDGCFGDSNISPTDIDGMVERNGRFLIIETKNLGVEIPEGQQITFDHLVNMGEANTFVILVVWGNTNNAYEMCIWPGKKKRADNNALRAVVSRWYKMADNVKLTDEQIRMNVNDIFDGQD